ncbi:MAG TPA: nucleotide exchange factor GrpE [Patescibacteria group bacterium]
MNDDDRRDKKKEGILNELNGSENAEESEVLDKKEENRDNVLLQKIADLEDKYRRVLADYQNLVRRTQEEKREWAKLSNKEMILKLLPILDTLMLAEKHTQDKNFVLTVQHFLSALEEEGVIRIKTIGEEFNPQTMEAVSTVEGESGKVMEEMRAGYLLYDTVLRPAQVIVGA